MKRTLFVAVMFLMLIIFACSEKDNNPTDTNIYGYRLNQFVSQAAVRDFVDIAAPDTSDFRPLFAYEIVASDGWSPRLSSNAGYDLNWETFKSGYLVPSDSRKTWFPNYSLPGAFRVRNTSNLRLYRKVDVETGRGTKQVELRGLQPVCMDNWSHTPEDAIKLSDLLQGITNYNTVRLIAVDGYTMDYTPEQISDGYYFLGTEVTTFPTFNDGMTGAQKKFKKLLKVQVLDANAQDFSFPLASSEHHSLMFTVPESLTGYEATVLTGY